MSLILDTPAGAPPASRALTTRFLDFWLLGGASVAIWLVMIVAQPFRSSWAVDQHFKNLTYTAASLSLLVNYPHFLISYQLAYSRGRAFVFRHWWQLVVVPAGLLAIFAVAYLEYAVPVARLPLVEQAARALAGWGTNARVVSGPRLGDVMFTGVFDVMVLTVGWHYTKQVFGCMMVYAHLDGYTFTAPQRLLTKWALLSIWWLSFIGVNIDGGRRTFSQFTYYSFDLPDVLLPIAEVVVAAGFVAVLYAVFYVNYRKTGRRPSANLVVPFVALYVWWLPLTRQYEFYFLLTPFFHSLQYLAFVYKLENSRLSTTTHRELRATALVTGVVFAGWLAFEFVPNTIDTRLGTFNAWQMFFFFTAAMLFINIHHYFIDNVLWRFKDPDVRRHLLSP